MPASGCNLTLEFCDFVVIEGGFSGWIEVLTSQAGFSLSVWDGNYRSTLQAHKILKKISTVFWL